MNIDEFTQQYNTGRRDFRFENLAKIDLAWRQDLIDCNFEGCDLSHANLAAVNFSNSNFQDANLEFANLSGANLSQANLQGTNLEGANLSQTKLHGVQYNDSTQFPQGITPEFIHTQVKISPNPPPHPLESERMKSASAFPRTVNPSPTEIEAQNQDIELPPPLPSALANVPPSDEIPPDALVINEPPPLSTASSPIPTENGALNWHTLSTFKAHNPIKLLISPDSSLLAIGKNDSNLQLWTINSSTPKFDYMFVGQQKGIYAIAFSPNQELIASGAGDGKVTIWDIRSKRLHQTLAVSSYIADAASHNQKLFQIFNPSLFVMSTAIAVSAIAFSPKGDRLVIGYADGTLRNWDVNSARILKEIKIHSAPITQIKYSQNGKLMLTASMDQTVKVMIPELWNLCHSYHYEAAWPSDCVITPDHELMIAGLSNGNIHARNLVHETVQYDMKSSHDPGLMNLYLHSSDSRLMSVSQDRRIKLWKLKTGEQLGSLSGSYPSCLSPNQTILATTNNKAEIQLFKKIT